MYGKKTEQKVNARRLLHIPSREAFPHLMEYLEEETKNGPSLQDVNNKEMDSTINESLQEYKNSSMPSNIEIMLSNLIPASTPGEATMEYGQHPMVMDSGLNPSSVRPRSSHKALCAGEGKDGIKTNEVRSDYHLRSRQKKPLEVPWILMSSRIPKRRVDAEDDADTASNSRGPEHVVGADAPNEIDQLMEVTTENNGVGASKISNEQVLDVEIMCAVNVRMVDRSKWRSRFSKS
ncbi:hypothetical protein GQR58_009743 [Nymphon striatum]|nr:hypothetical protein GQR58_009743 [Nymphon striatum]